MEKPFEFGINESWDALGHLIGRIVNDAPGELNGLGEMREQWEDSKGPLLELLGPGGRLVFDLDNALISKEDAHRAERAAYDYVYMRETTGKITPSVRVDAVVVLQDLLYRTLTDETRGRVLAENKLVEALPDPRPGREGQVLGVGTKLGRYTRLVVESNTNIDSDTKEVVANTVCEALSRSTSCLSGRDQKLILSVNPLEMVMASMHTTGWTSCHDIRTGCYATGPLSYMLDDCTAIAYTTSRDDYFYLVGKVLPVKTWRQMVFFDLKHGSALLSRQYADQVIWFARMARKAAATVLAKYHELESPRWYVVHDPACAREVGGVDDDPEDYTGVYVPHSGWHFADGIEARVRLKPNGVTPVVSPGVDDMLCPSCGGYRDDSQHSALVCEGCFGEACCMCGAYIRGDGSYDDGNNNLYCEECYSEFFTECAYCNDAVNREDAYNALNEHGDEVELCSYCFNHYIVSCINCDLSVDSDYTVTDRDGDYWCRSCAHEHLQECVECGEHCRTEDVVECTHGNLYCGDCAEYVLSACCRCGELCVHDNMVTDVYGDVYCDDCTDQHLVQCDDCLEYFLHQEMSKWCAPLCVNCASAREEKEEIVDVG